MIIYKTTNTINGKIYVGQDTRNLPKYLGSGKLLHKAIKKYHITEENRALFQELSVFGTVRTLWMSIVQ